MLPYKAGFRIHPSYSFFAANLAYTPEGLAEALSNNERRWEERVRAHKRAAVTMEEVLVDRLIQRVYMENSYYPVFVFMDGSEVRLNRTRGYSAVTFEGPTEGPFLIKRILTNRRTFRLDDGRTIHFSTKLELRSDTIPDWIIDQVFPP